MSLWGIIVAAHLEHEWELYQHGYRAIAGIDEVGRGCWAGPVVAAAVVFNDSVLHMPTLVAGLNDSKQLSAIQREHLYLQIHALADGIGVGMVSAHDIDCLGILNATKIAMQHAIMALPLIPDALLIDAVSLPHWRQTQRAIIKGDSVSLSIAAASVIAKVTRDRFMIARDRHYPGYGFAQHKGYGTAVHQQAIAQHGLLDCHRYSFRPMSDMIGTGTTQTPYNAHDTSST